MRLIIRILIVFLVMSSTSISMISAQTQIENKGHPLYLDNLPSQNPLNDTISSTDGQQVYSMLKAEASSREYSNKTKRYNRKTEYLELLPKHLRDTEWGCPEIKCFKGLLSTIGESKDISAFQPYSGQILEWIWATSDHSWVDEYIINQLMFKMDSPIGKLLLDIKRSAMGQFENQILRIDDLASLSEDTAPKSLYEICKEAHRVQDTQAYMFNVLYKGHRICQNINAINKPEDIDTYKWIEGNAFAFNLSELLKNSLANYRELDKVAQSLHPSNKLYSWLGQINHDDLFGEIDKTIDLAKKLSNIYRVWFYLRPQLSKDMSDLNDGDVALQYVKYKLYDEYDIGAYKYLVFAIKNNHGNIQTTIHKLGSQFSIDQEKENFRKLLSLKKSDSGLRQSSANLFKLLLQPIWSEVKSANNIYISGMDDIPFHLMRSSSKEELLLENKNIAYFNVWNGVSSRFLNSTGLPRDDQSTNPTFFGNPSFGSNYGQTTEVPKSYYELRGTHGFPFPFVSLENTGKEVNQITSSHPKKEVDVFLGKRASEMAFFKVKSPRILHIASHGYFYRDSAGLALANSNLALEGNGIIGGLDGLLTDSEIATLDLNGTDLAVLSACETGLGTHTSGGLFYGDNVASLSSAFHNAGVEDVVVSLWQVDDETTAEFMAEFYRRYFKLSDVSRSLQETQISLRNKYARTVKESPYFWGAFVPRVRSVRDTKVDKAIIRLVKKSQSGDLESKFLTSRDEQIKYRPYSIKNIPSYTGTSVSVIDDKNVWQNKFKRKPKKAAGKSLGDDTYDPCTDPKYQDELKELQNSFNLRIKDGRMSVDKTQVHILKLADLTQKIAMQSAGCY